MSGDRTTTGHHTRTRASSTTSPTSGPRWCGCTCHRTPTALLSVADHCLRSRQYINVIVAGKQPALNYLSMDEAIAHCTRGAGIWEWAGSETEPRHPMSVLACAGDIPTLETVAAADILRARLPGLAGAGRQRGGHHAAAAAVRAPARDDRSRVRCVVHHRQTDHFRLSTAIRG